MKQSNTVKQSSHDFSVHSLRAKVTFGALIPLVLILGTFMTIQYKTQQKVMMENLALLASQTALTIENSLQKAMLHHDQAELQDILNSIGQNKMLASVYLMDTTGKVVFSPDARNVDEQLSNSDPTCQPCHHLPPAQRPASVVVTIPGGRQVFRSMNPIRNDAQCYGCHSPLQRLNGVLLTDISMTPLEASLDEDLWQQLLWWGSSILVSILVINIVFDRFILRRLEALSGAIKKLGLGQQSLLLPEDRIDEIGQVTLAFNEMSRQIGLREAENQQLSEDLNRKVIERSELLNRVITAQEDERKRVARELHDELGQALAVLSLQTEAAHNLVKENPERAVQVLDQTQRLVSGTIEQMYNLILALRPSSLDDLGLVVALRSHAERMMHDTGIDFTLDASALPDRLPPDLEIVLYRVYQEALANILRHARASRVAIRLAREDGHFVGEIVDNGQGFDWEMVRSNPDCPQGLGLLGMQERIAQQNGELEIFSEKGCGTLIHIRVPIQEVQHD